MFHGETKIAVLHRAKAAVTELNLIKIQILHAKKYVRKLMLAAVTQSANIWDGKQSPSSTGVITFLVAILVKVVYTIN